MGSLGFRGDDGFAVRGFRLFWVQALGFRGDDGFAMRGFRFLEGQSRVCSHVNVFLRVVVHLPWNPEQPGLEDCPKSPAHRQNKP